MEDYPLSLSPGYIEPSFPCTNLRCVRQDRSERGVVDGRLDPWCLFPYRIDYLEAVGVAGEKGCLLYQR